jgi:hypothetical protein
VVQLTGLNELVRRWEAVAAALQRGDEDACLPAVQSWIEEWDRRFWSSDFSGFERIYAPDFVGHTRIALIGTSSIHGPQGFVKLREEVSEAASRFWFDVREVRLGLEGAFAGIGRLKARGRYSGLVLQAPLAVVWRARDGMLVEATAYLNPRRALRELEAGAAVA